MAIPLAECREASLNYIERTPLDPNSATREHVIPRSFGGCDEDHNLVASCNRCNALRGTIDWRVFATIVAKLLQDEVVREVWHSNDPVVFKLVRKIVRLELKVIKARSCRKTAFEVFEEHPHYIEQRTAA